MKQNPIFKRKVPSSAKGYSSFPMDHFANFTSVAGYLIPVYWDYLEPGDKVTCKTLLRTITQPLTKPAMATCIERVEWFAVPIQQLYKPFSSKFYGINDVESDLLPINGYDDYVPYVDLDELDNMIAGLPTSYAAQSSTPTAIPTGFEAKRLIDAIGVSNVVGQTSVPANTSLHRSISILPFAAYQKIYFDHYRLSDREDNNPLYYNFDSFFGTTGVSAKVQNTSPDYRLYKLFFLHKRPYMRDYFTSMQVSPLFGSSDTNAAGNDLGALESWLNGLSSVATGVPGSSSGPTGIINVQNTVPTSTRIPYASTANPGYNQVSGMLNPQNIRSIFAVEKLLEVTRRAKKHYDMQTLAHFGVKVPKGLAGECYKLGTHEQYLKIGDVVSTSDTTGASLGALAGKGSSGGESKSIKFEADCHCVLMAIYSVEPVVNVSNEGLPRQLTQIRTSEFYKSEFDNLGMQPVFRSELYHNFVSLSDPSSLNTVIGWNYRYYQMKSKYNRSFGGICTTAFSEWALNRQTIGTGAGFSNNFFKVWPTDLNNILQVPYSFSSLSVSNTFSLDYFINQIYFDVIKTSKKSIYGEPQL